jgi:hypothetical protein
VRLSVLANKIYAKLDVRLTSGEPSCEVGSRQASHLVRLSKLANEIYPCRQLDDADNLMMRTI